MGIVYIIMWLILCLAVYYVAEHIGRNGSKFFLISLFLSPLVGFIILAIEGKATKEEILDSTSHIFYCSNCKSVFSGTKEEDLLLCPKCNNELIETSILADSWHSYDDKKKEALITSFVSGKYIRGKELELASPSNEQSAADEIEKFKNLLDKGIITQEEFDAKKKQLLGL